MSTPFPPFKLNNDAIMPAIGLGCWMGTPGEAVEVENMVKNAVKAGYRKFDTAFGYGNEETVGKAIRECGIPREQLFIATKLTNSHHGSVTEGFEQSFSKLNIGHIDLYLMHWPQAFTADGTPLQPEDSPTFVETYLEMEKLLNTGKVRSIGVSNFSIKSLDILLPKISIVPVVNQVELHPCLPQEPLLAYCTVKGIRLEAYCPLGQYNSPLLKEETILSVAEKNKCSPAQVLLSWGVQRGTAVVPKSSNPERIKQNITLLKLSDDDMAAVSSIHKKPGMHRSLDALVRHNYEWNKASAGDGLVFGWTMEQLGWPLDRDGKVIE